MTHRPIVRFSAVVAAALMLAACHPGRHKGTVLPPGATTPPGTEPINSLGTASAGGGHGGNNCPKSSAQLNGCPSTYALTSDPSGITVQRLDPSGQTTQYNTTVTTPATDPLPDSSTNMQYRFATNNAAGPFTVNVQQIHDGPHQVYYNRNSDSTGHIDGSSLQSIGRGVLSSASGIARSSIREMRRTVNARTTSGIVQNKLYVRFSNDHLRANGRTVDAAIRALGTRGVELPTTNSDPLTVVDVPSGTTPQAYAASLLAQPGVAAVFPVHQRYTLSKTQTIPNDPDFIIPNEWYLYATGFPYAWSYTKGAGATIAVIDTGVDLTNTDISTNVVFSETVVQGVRSSTITDKDGHGTNVAGIADALAGNGTAFGSGNHNFAGGGYSAKLIAIDIFSNSGTALGSDEAIAIGDAIAHNADVVNLSLGAPESFGDNQYNSSDWNGGYDEGEFEGIQAALAAGTTVVAAAGNNRDGKDSSGDGFQHLNLDYPAGYPGVISVGASDLVDNGSGDYSASTEAVAPYSQAGVGLSVVAPGGNATGGSDNDILHWIWNYYSTAATDPCTYGNGTLAHIPTNCTALFNGTSQATPQVSAAAALLYSAAGGHRSLQPAAVKQLIEDTADNINDPYQGHGRLDVYRAVASLLQDTGAIATGPHALPHSATQMIAFAYSNSGSNRPAILDYDYPVGVPVASDGSFRIADVRPADATNFKVAVWLDINGDGIIDAGDYFGASSASCNVTSGCTIGTIKPALVTGTSFTLP
ncbi:MAG TPA: S8 family serine peptidase [Candidatus Elarobacter sp.]|nr:S8 family serine peptidase [Candidatus Elarobacter sp.]